MGNLNLDIEGIKEILKVEIQRSLKHSQHIQIESQFSDIKKYESLLKNAVEKKNFNKEDQLLIDKVDERIEQHMKKLGYKVHKDGDGGLNQAIGKCSLLIGLQDILKMELH